MRAWAVKHLHKGRIFSSSISIIKADCIDWINKAPGEPKNCVVVPVEITEITEEEGK